MTVAHSDALVFFGATGDLAHKEIFPALQAMIRHGHLDMPIIGVAKSGWNLEQLKARARDSVEKYGSLDPAAFAKLSALLQYIDGDYRDDNMYRQLRAALGSSNRPLHYLIRGDRLKPAGLLPGTESGRTRQKSGGRNERASRYRISAGCG